MSDIKVSQLAEINAVSENDLIMVVEENGFNKKIKVGNFKDKIIQENGLATTNNVYSAVAVDKKIDNLDVIDITDKYTTYFTKTFFKAFYYKKTDIVEIIYRFTNISGNNWVNLAVLNDVSYKPTNSAHEDTAYGSGAQTAFVQINGSGNLQFFANTGTDMVAGSIRYVVNNEV